MISNLVISRQNVKVKDACAEHAVRTELFFALIMQIYAILAVVTVFTA